ncbi:MAG TPA: hypothetical protein VK979_00240, partial [Guyparkeria sp.]|nr:hypothetical protein [Guyparkeria sp.]
ALPGAFLFSLLQKWEVDAGRPARSGAALTEAGAWRSSRYLPSSFQLAEAYLAEHGQAIALSLREVAT